MKIRYLLILFGFHLFNCQAAAIKQPQLLAKELQLFEAINDSDLEAIQQLISQNVNVNSVNPKTESIISYKDGVQIISQIDVGETPLHFASKRRKNIKIIEKLIIAGANINARVGDRKTTALYSTIYEIPEDKNLKRQAIEKVKFLLERGADPSITNIAGRTILQELNNKKKYRQQTPSLFKTIAEDLKWIDEIESLLNRSAEIHKEYEMELALEAANRLQKFNFPREVSAVVQNYIIASDWERNIKPKTQGTPGSHPMDFSQEEEVEV